MKIIAPLFAGLLWIIPAFAQDKPPDAVPEPHQQIVGNPGLELGFLVQCMATESTLMHLHMEVAASIVALSSDKQPQKQLAMLADSYKMMAEANAKTVKLISETIKTAVVPQITANGHFEPKDVNAKLNQMLSDSLDDITTVMANPLNDMNAQVSVEELLMKESSACETLANKVMVHHTI